jgi:hypothetical protein
MVEEFVHDPSHFHMMSQTKPPDVHSMDSSRAAGEEVGSQNWDNQPSLELNS